MIFIIVAVSDSAYNIKAGLTERGYTVVDLYSYHKPVDAVIYEGNRFDFSAITDENINTVMSTNVNNSYGVFVICSNGKSIEEIDYMLKTRCYSSLI